MVQVKKVKAKTKEKVLKILKELGNALTVYSIRVETGINQESIRSALNELIDEGEVVQLPTSPYISYMYSGDTKC